MGIIVYKACFFNDMRGGISLFDFAMSGCEIVVVTGNMVFFSMNPN